MTHEQISHEQISARKAPTPELSGMSEAQRNECPLERLVMLLCDHPKCPRKKKVPWDKTIPEGTATIVT